MTFHIYKQEAITPAPFSVNVRGHVDSDGPHLITLGVRCVVLDGAASGSVRLKFRYENPNGEIQEVFTNWTVLNDTSQAGGGIWYKPMEISVDKYWPVGNGPFAEDPNGIFKLELEVNPNVGTSKITYEAIVTTFDGSPAVVMHP